MKLKSYTSLFIIVLIINACKKDPQIKPVSFPDATYQSLAPYDSKGQPDNLLTDIISPDLVTYVNQMLVDRNNLTISHPELFTGANPADIPVNQSSDVFVTFVFGNAGNSNTLGFYTYPTGQPPTSDKDVKLITYIFPNAGVNSPLKAGDKMYLGKFNVGTTIGFVILQNAWDTSKSFINSDATHFCSTDALNPEMDPKLKRHAVVLDYSGGQKLIGFEDRNRASLDCDQDFNDIVFYCTVTPN